MKTLNVIGQTSLASVTTCFILLGVAGASSAAPAWTAIPTLVAAVDEPAKADPPKPAGGAGSGGQSTETGAKAPAPEKPKPDLSKLQRAPGVAAPNTGPVADPNRPDGPAPINRGPNQPSHDQLRDDLPNRLNIDPSIKLVEVEPMVIELGEMPATMERVSRVVKIKNITDMPVKLLECKATCGCTTPRCPKGQDIQPGESVEVIVDFVPGTKANAHISKSVIFKIEGQMDVNVSLVGSVVEYVVTEPTEFDPLAPGDGKLVVRSIDDQPFIIKEVTPEIFLGLDEEPHTRHELTFSQERWEELSKRYVVNFTVEHPKAKSVQVQLKRPPRDPQPGGGHIEELPPQNPERTALLNAVNAGNVEQALKAIEAGAEVNGGDSRGYTPLITAAEKGDVAMIKALINGGHADVEAADRAGFTPLTHASQSGNADVVKAMRDTGAPEAKIASLVKGDAVKALLAAGANPNSRDQTGGTPLTWAAGPKGFAGSVRLLIDAGADVNTPNDLGMTPIMWAGWFGDAERVKMLAEAGAEVNVFGGPEDMTPLIVAVQMNTVETVKALLDAGAHVNDRDGAKRSAIEYALDRQEREAQNPPETQMPPRPAAAGAIIDLLKAHGATLPAPKPGQATASSAVPAPTAK